MANSTYLKLLEDRKALPIYAYKESLIKAVKDHQVLVIIGDTGSGKSTQIPQYLHEAGFTTHGMLACTQPRRVPTLSIASRVSQEMGIILGHEVGFSTRFEDSTSNKTLIKYMTNEMLLREFVTERNLAPYSVVMVDEAHERTLSTDILLGILKGIVRRRSEFKLLISCATLDAEKFSDYFDSTPIFRVPGPRFPVELFYTKNPEDDYMDAVSVTIVHIHLVEPCDGDCDILVFLPSHEEIEKLEKILKHKISGLGGHIPEMIICPLHENLANYLHAKVFEPTPEHARKVVLATNIAETSFKIHGIKYVIDSGFSKLKSYNPNSGMESFNINPISKASANLRAAQSCRNGPGKCYRLYTPSYYFNDLEDNTIPEIQRTDVGNVILDLKSLGIHDFSNFDFIDPPPACNYPKI